MGCSLALNVVSMLRIFTGGSDFWRGFRKSRAISGSVDFWPVAGFGVEGAGF